MSSAVRVGLIGAGRWGARYLQTLPALGERCRLTHLCTSRPENAALVPHPVAVLSDWRQLLRTDCDAVIIASPASTHADIVEACVKARKPCLVEKPFCKDTATAERLSKLIQASGVLVLVDYTHLFNPAYQELKRRLTEAGEPVRLILSEGMAWGPFRRDESALWDWCPHDLAMCLDLLGCVPERVDALGGPTGPDGAPEQVSLRLEFPGGALAWIQAGRLSPSKRRLLHVVTDSRSYRFDDLAKDHLTVAPSPFARRYDVPDADRLEPAPIPLRSATAPLTAAVLYFLDALAGGDRRFCDVTMSVALTRVLEQCERIMQRGAAAKA